jgi:hypothetical protein
MRSPTVALLNLVLRCVRNRYLCMPTPSDYELLKTEVHQQSKSARPSYQIPHETHRFNRDRWRNGGNAQAEMMKRVLKGLLWTVNG